LLAGSDFPPYLFLSNAVKDFAHDGAGFVAQPDYISSRDEGRGAYDVLRRADVPYAMAKSNQVLTLPGQPTMGTCSMFQEGKCYEKPYLGTYEMDELPEGLLVRPRLGQIQ
jgi:hypothetical protein